MVGDDGQRLERGAGEPARLLPALASLRSGDREIRTILVPHEPTEAHLARSEAALDALGLRHVRLGALDPASIPEIVIVDRVGVLGDLYALADMAYVGGGFGTAGLHSVLEPAAFGAPVLFGPRHANAREAAEMIAAAGAFEVPDEAALRDRLRALSDDAPHRRRGGDAARAYVQANLGAAERGAELVVGFLNG